MTQLLQTSGTNRFALFIAVAIALDITVHELFLLVAMTVAACVYLMIGVFHQRKWAVTQAQRHT